MLPKSWRVGLLGAVISILAVIAIVSQVDLALLRDALAKARYSYILPTLALLIAGQVTRAARWRALLGGTLPLRRAFSILNVSYLVNGILPLRLGEVARAFLATRSQPPVPVFRSVSTIIVERMLDLLAVLVLLGGALALSPALPPEYRTAASASVAVLVAGFAILIVLANRRDWAQRALALVERALPAAVRSRLDGWLDGFLDGLQPLTSPLLAARVLFWTALSWGLSVAAGYVLMYTLFDGGDWAATFLYIAAAAFAIAVPAVPGNIGTYEWAVMLAMSASGYGQPTSPTLVLFAVMVHGVNLALYAVFGAVAIIQEGITLGQLSAGVERLNNKRIVPQEKLEYVE